MLEINTTIISPAEFISMPWRNGQGTTIELLKRGLWGDNSDEFAWRLSMATVVEDGRFSNFTNYDRTLVLLEGRGLTLEHNSDQIDVLSKPLQLAQFSGDSDTMATLHDGPIKDFNIMTRHGVCRARTLCSIDSRETKFVTVAATLLVFSVQEDTVIEFESSDKMTIPNQSLLLLEQLPNQPVRLTGVAFIVVEMFDELRLPA